MWTVYQHIYYYGKQLSTYGHSVELKYVYYVWYVLTPRCIQLDFNVFCMDTIRGVV